MDKQSKKKSVSGSLAGQNRSENQDNLLIIEEKEECIYIVFDGVGSASNSKLATNLAINFIADNYKKVYAKQISISELMYDCNLYLLSTKISELYTTYCIVFVSNDTDSSNFRFSTMGDSRIYVVTNQYIDQISKDDKSKLYKNTITKCLGMDLLKSDFQERMVTRDEASILLCTDGFYNLLEENRLKFFETFQKSNLKAIHNDLVSYLNGHNTDDATYIFVK